VDRLANKAQTVLLKEAASSSRCSRTHARSSAANSGAPWVELKERLSALVSAVDQDDYDQVRKLLRETVSGYAPDGEIVDWMHQQRRQNV
jgi:hypothetical protein